MAEEYKHIDQIIRQKFEDFEPEPPIQVWENIKSGISKAPPPPSSPGILMPIIITVSLLIFVAGLFHHFYNETPENTLAAESSAITIQSASLGSTGSTTVTDQSLQESFYQTPSAIPPVKVAEKAPDQKQAEVIPVRVPFEQNSATDRKKKSGKSSKTSTYDQAARSGQWKPGLVQAIKTGELTYSDAVKYDLSPRDYRKISSYREYAGPKLAEWSVGLFFNPEVTTSQDATIDNSITYNISVLPRVSFNRFFIQSGLNVRLANDKGNYTVDYNRFLGSYEDVYLVTFDSTENGIIPTYYTQTVDVFDTIDHYSVSETKVNYTYLEIPLLFGYRYDFGKFSLFANAGPSAAFLAGKHVPVAENPEENAKIINVNYQVPLRSTINWQMMMGAGFDYKLADKLSFSLEPTFRFSLNPEYNMPSGASVKTSAFGVRLGLNYNF
ncbi:MAG: PorT family protein [Bacteroidales bacterium]|nr:PorT family protein [Bacteroidales bacterium]